MTVNFLSVAMVILLAVLTGGFLMAAGACIGGIFVYRTKRDSHESLFAPKAEPEDKTPVNMDEYEQKDLTDFDVNSEIEKIFKEREEEERQNPLDKANKSFKEQMND